MRYVGTNARGVRLPIISAGDALPELVVNSVLEMAKTENIIFNSSDVIGITESIVAKAQGNYASLSHVAEDIKRKFPSGEVGLVFPILSRNRFLNILKGISLGADKVYILLNYPSDEVGNPILDILKIDEVEDCLQGKMVSASEFRKITGDFVHPFTNIDYISLYESVSDKIEIYFSKDPRDILKLTKNVLACEIHNRFVTKQRLLKAGVENVYTLSDILSESVDGSGFNEDYGILGSNLSTGDKLKLFPRDCDNFVSAVRNLFLEKTGVSPEVLIYGDGAFKDPACGIWELADPVVSPGHTERLGGQPNEIKLKYIADNEFGHLQGSEKKEAVSNLIKQKQGNTNPYNDGTTPRKYADLLGSLCDLMSGSGDKGTPVIYIKGYFDDYTVE